MNVRHFGVLAICITICAWLGCTRTNEPNTSTGATSTRSSSTAGNLPAPAFTLIDQSGQPFDSRALAGKVWIANVIFTRCTATCPVQTANLALLQKSLSHAPGHEDLRLISISIDPDFDRPEVMRDYAAKYDADTSTWKFLTGGRNEIYQITGEGFKLPVFEGSNTGEGIMSHSPKFVLVDRGGKIVSYFEGTDLDELKQLETQVRALLAAAAPASRAAAGEIGAPNARKPTYFPPGVEDPKRQNLRRALQLATRNQFKVIHDFSFTDTQPTSGIDFLQHFVDDQGKTFKAVHYDHGTGVAVADVDGDGLLDIYFVSQVGPNRLYRNLGGDKFADVTEEAGVAADGIVHVGASFADIDNDGDPDLYITAVRSPNMLFENTGGGKFKDISAESGLAYNEHSSAADFFDYDRDGRLDVFLAVVGEYTKDKIDEVTGTPSEERLPGQPRTYHEGYEDAFGGHLKPERTRQSLLFHNDGGNHFSDVTDQVGLKAEGWTGDATPTDFNNDGWSDLYILNMQGHDEYWVNAGGQRFVDQSKEVFPRTPWGSMGVKAFDYNNDGNLDLMLTDMHSDMSKLINYDQEQMKASWITENWPESFLRSGGRSIFGNAFFRNDGDDKFVEVSDRIGTENYWPWGVSVGDLNADGWQDAFITSSMCYPYYYQPNTLLLNNAGEKFLPAEYLLGIEPRRGGRVVTPWFDLDCSGADKDHELCRGQAGPIEVFGALGTRSSVIFDADNDGDLDIITNDCGSAPMVLLSSFAKEHGPKLHFVKVKLTGTKSNRDALGARVTVTADDHKWVQVNDGQSGYLSQSSMPLYFGLGGGDKVDRIDVTWPNGQKSSVEKDFKINDVNEITEPND